MATPSVEQRLAALEAEVADLKKRLERDRAEAALPWWEQIFGTFAGSEGFDEAVRLGREYRESFRPKEEKDAGRDALGQRGHGDSSSSLPA